MAPSTPPPRLLIGAALLLWGAMGGHPVIGLVLALVVEASHWTAVRWKFGHLALQRAWQLSVLLLLLTALLIWISGERYDALPRAFRWLPVVLLPLQFVQNYGMHRTISLTAFSHFLRKKREHARRYGLPFREIRFSFGNTYFLAVLIAASLGENADSAVFYPAAVLLLLGLLLAPLLKRPRRDLIGPLLVLPVAIFAGLKSESIINDLIVRYANSRTRSIGGFSQENQTRIGGLEGVKMSPAIRWRLIPRHGPLPRLLRVASYNYYVNTRWSAIQPPDATGDAGFNELGAYAADPNVLLEDSYRITGRTGDEGYLDGPAASESTLPRCILRGELESGPTLLPLPGDAASIIQAAQNLEINDLGTLRIEPRHPVADALILTRRGTTTARGPWELPESDLTLAPSLEVPRPEQPALRAVVRKLGLDDLPLQEKIDRLRAWFLEDFTYARYGSIPLPPLAEGRSKFITDFLFKLQSGHCEYFATATALILREAGVPTRYASGFAVIERDAKGVALLRGIHAHAWALAWDAERQVWVDVDLTPPDWTGLETPRVPAWQPWLDRLQILRDNFLVWRTKPGHLALVIGLIAVPLLGGGWFIARRLWISRQNVGRHRDGHLRFTRTASPLERLEKAAAKHLGQRPDSVPLAYWLAALRASLSEPADLDRALVLHRQLRFDPHSDPAPLQAELDQLAHRLRPQIRAIGEKPGVRV
ncbi:transglutaminase-like domain-containing protein [Haloferula sargassicola]|uniref:Transglutaminase-like domain-containing protein n=1 Tax=Haloferula sargassicola TaxID=490096 RepID=A0ABP9UK71_9BACT